MATASRAIAAALTVTVSQRSAGRNTARSAAGAGSERSAASRPSAAKFATIAEPPKLRKGVTTPVSGTTPRMPAAISSTGTAKNSVRMSAQEEPVVGRRPARGAQRAPDERGIERGDREHADRAKVLPHRREHEIGVTGWQVARVTEPEAGAHRTAGRERPQRLRDLIAAARGVVPRRLPHAHAIGERGRDLEAVAEVEAGGEHRGAREHEPDRASRAAVHREEHDGQHQRRPEIPLKKEQRQRRADADHDRHGVAHARNVEPARHADAADRGLRRRRAGPPSDGRSSRRETARGGCEWPRSAAADRGSPWPCCPTVRFRRGSARSRAAARRRAADN